MITLEELKGIRNVEKIEHGLTIGRTSFLCWIIVAIILLQNGPLNNLPITLLLLLIPTAKGLIFHKPGKCEKVVLFYGVYLLIITLLNFGDNFDPNYTINLFIQYFIIYTCLKFTIVNINAEKFLIFLRNFGLVLSAFCLVEALSKKHIWASILGKGLTEGTTRVVGFFNHPIVCSCFLLITLILTIVFPIRKKRTQVVAIIGVVSAIILTQSRSAWIAAAVVLFIYLLKFHSHRIDRSYLIYGMLAVGIAFMVSIALGYNVAAEIVRFISTRIQGSLEAGEGHIVRIEIILNSFEYWKSHIGDLFFGRGKNYGLLFLKYNPIKKFGTFTWSAAIDNQYITLIHETGLVGLILIFYVIAMAFKRFTTSNKINKLQIAVSLCLIGNAICMFFYEGLNYPVMVLLYMIFIFLSDFQETYVSNIKIEKLEIDDGKKGKEYSDTQRKV